MLPLPRITEPLLMSLGIAFTAPTFNRILPLLVGTVLLRGRRTITSTIWVMRGLVPGHSSDYHRVFSRAAWVLWPLGKVLATFVVALAEEHGRKGWILVAGDDTVAEAKGKRVYGKGCHHDAVRSSPSHTVWRWVHRWVVLAIFVKFPFARRAWALPVLVALYRPKEVNEQEGRRHKTHLDLARGLFAVLLHWFPEKKFVFLGDGGYASHEFASFFHDHRRRAALVARFRGGAALYDPPPPYNGHGRPRVKGQRQKSPEKVVVSAGLRNLTVAWYGVMKRKVKIRDRIGYWYKNGDGLIRILGYLCATTPAPAGTNTSTPRTPTSRRPRSVTCSPAAGRSKPPSRKCALTWASRPPAAGAKRRYCGSAPAFWGCSASSV